MHDSMTPMVIWWAGTVELTYQWALGPKKDRSRLHLLAFFTAYGYSTDACVVPIVKFCSTGSPNPGSMVGGLIHFDLN